MRPALAGYRTGLDLPTPVLCLTHLYSMKGGCMRTKVDGSHYDGHWECERCGWSSFFYRSEFADGLQDDRLRVCADCGHVAGTVTLCPLDDSYAYDRRPVVIVVRSANSVGWVGQPINNPACPALMYPRYAWREVGTEAR